MEQWQNYSEKFNNISSREQYLIIASGVACIVFLCYILFVDEAFQELTKFNKKVPQIHQDNKKNTSLIKSLEESLTQDPNARLKKEIAQHKEKLSNIDQRLLLLTSNLIGPIQMRHALIKLLKLQKGVKLLSFNVLPANSVIDKNTATDKGEVKEPLPKADSKDVNVDKMRLYRHGIKIKLQGSFFQLRDYLAQLENLSWKFFWQEFKYELKEYPLGELEIEIYSLSTAQEFIGV